MVSPADRVKVDLRGEAAGAAWPAIPTGWTPSSWERFYLYGLRPGHAFVVKPFLREYPISWLEAVLPWTWLILLLAEGCPMKSWGAKNATAYTQGLIYREGFLFESTGLNGQSSIRYCVRLRPREPRAASDRLRAAGPSYHRGVKLTFLQGSGRGAGGVNTM
jgi:hypothetical protein